MTSGIPASVPYWRLSAFYFFYFALLGAWVPYWPLYLHDLQFDAATIGYLTSVMLVTKVFAPSLWGWIADRSGRRIAVIRWGALGALLTFALLLVVPPTGVNLALLTVAYSFFLNAVLAQFDVVTLAHLRGHYHYYSKIRLWGSIGFIVTVLALGLLLEHLSLQWLPVLLTGFLLALWLSSLLVSDAGTVRQHTAQKPQLQKVLRQPVVLGFFLVCFLLQLSHGPYYTFFTVYLEDEGYSRATAGLLWSLGVFAEVVLFLFMHRLMQQFSLRQILLASLALSALRWVLIGTLVDSWPVLVGAQLLHAASFGSFHACGVEMVRRLFGGGLEGQGMALYGGLSFGLGGALGAVLSGWLWPVSSTATFLLAALMCMLACYVSAKWVRADERVPIGQEPAPQALG